MKKFFLLILFLLILAGGYIYRENVKNFLEQQMDYFAPCWEPITYSLGNFDTQFTLSKEQFLSEIQRAEKIWEVQAQRELFHYVETGGALTVNLIYDERQASVDELKKIGIVISNNEETYNALKAKYTTLSVAYDQQKKLLDGDIRKLTVQQDAYEKDVSYWNSRGGASKGEYEKLQERKRNINTLIDTINISQWELNKKADTINTLARSINHLISVLNLNVAKYNTTNFSNGEEFEEGEYIRDASGQRINIYEFGNEIELIRVLTHELGHALGLMHVTDPGAIMYELNQGNNETLTEADIRELTSVCGV